MFNIIDWKDYSKIVSKEELGDFFNSVAIKFDLMQRIIGRCSEREVINIFETFSKEGYDIILYDDCKRTTPIDFSEIQKIIDYRWYSMDFIQKFTSLKLIIGKPLCRSYIADNVVEYSLYDKPKSRSKKIILSVFNKIFNSKTLNELKDSSDNISIAFDFDGVITSYNTKWSEDGSDLCHQKPNIDIISLMRLLNKISYEDKLNIYIYTMRAYGDEEVQKKLKDWLYKYRVPYKEIVYELPKNTLLIVDDGGICCNTYEDFILAATYIKNRIPWHKEKNKKGDSDMATTAKKTVAKKAAPAAKKPVAKKAVSTAKKETTSKKAVTKKVAPAAKKTVAKKATPAAKKPVAKKTTGAAKTTTKKK